MICCSSCGQFLHVPAGRSVVVFGCLSWVQDCWEGRIFTIARCFEFFYCSPCFLGGLTGFCLVALLVWLCLHLVRPIPTRYDICVLTGFTVA